MNLITHENWYYTTNSTRWSNVMGEIIPFDFNVFLPISTRKRIKLYVPGDLVKTTWNTNLIDRVPTGIVCSVMMTELVEGLYNVCTMDVLWSMDPREI